MEAHLSVGCQTTQPMKSVWGEMEIPLILSLWNRFMDVKWQGGKHKHFKDNF